MKILILVVTITWSFGGGYQDSPKFVDVSSPEEAAIYIWREHEHAKWQVEPDQKKYELLEIDFETKKIKSVPIPKISFQLPAAPDPNNVTAKE